MKGGRKGGRKKGRDTSIDRGEFYHKIHHIQGIIHM
jgi:hypothetical protein